MQQHAKRVRGWALAALPKSKGSLRHSLYWVLARLGGKESIAALDEATDTTDDAEFREVVCALSWSPDERATKLLLAIVKKNLKTPRAAIAAREGIRRMVIGQEDVGNLSNKQRLDYADPLLNMVLDTSTITYLSNIRSGRCAHILQRTMRRGEPQTAAKAIIAVTNDLSGASAADRKLGAAALIDTIEFIEITQLRGGIAVALKKGKIAAMNYASWKALSAQAGKNLLKLDKPEEEPLPEFDDADLDL